MRIITIICFSLLALSSCEKVDVIDTCSGITCINGGICINGECDCPEGYEGPDCGRQITPTSIFVTNVTVLKFPATDENGDGWDFYDGADIYVTVARGNNKIYVPNGSNDNYDNADTSKAYDFNFGNNCELTELFEPHGIYLLDYDTLSAPDIMGGWLFFPYRRSGHFPSKITLDDGGDVAFELSLEYKFN